MSTLLPDFTFQLQVLQKNHTFLSLNPSHCPLNPWTPCETPRHVQCGCCSATVISSQQYLALKNKKNHNNNNNKKKNDHLEYWSRLKNQTVDSVNDRNSTSRVLVFFIQSLKLFFFLRSPLAFFLVFPNIYEHVNKTYH